MSNKISLLINSLGRGGTECQLIRLAQGLHAQGIAVEVWCYGGSSPLDHELTDLGIRVRTGTGGTQRQKIRLIRQWMTEFQPDILHGFMKRASSLAVLAGFASRKGVRRGGPASPGGDGSLELVDRGLELDARNLEVEARGTTQLPNHSTTQPTTNSSRKARIIGSDLSTATYSPRQPALWLALFLFAFADKVATQTELNRRSLERLAPWLKNKTVVIRNGLDLSRFEPRERDMGEGVEQGAESVGKKAKANVERRTEECVEHGAGSGGKEGKANFELRTENGAKGDGSADLRIGRGEGGKDVGKANVELRTSNVEHRTGNGQPTTNNQQLTTNNSTTQPPNHSTTQPFLFTVVGSVYAIKNPVRLVHAVKILQDQGMSGFRVDWYGRYGLGKEAESGSSEYHEACRLIEEHGLGDCFCFRGETAEIHERLPEADALIHPSLQEGFPNAVVEAMACGLPIVVSRVSDLPLVVKTAENGFVFDETDPAAIAEGMRKMMETGEAERREMGKRSRKLAEEWFGMDRFVAEYVELYQGLCKR